MGRGGRDSLRLRLARGVRGVPIVIGHVETRDQRHGGGSPLSLFRARVSHERANDRERIPDVVSVGPLRAASVETSDDRMQIASLTRRMQVHNTDVYTPLGVGVYTCVNGPMTGAAAVSSFPPPSFPHLVLSRSGYPSLSLLPRLSISISPALRLFGSPSLPLFVSFVPR